MSIAAVPEYLGHDFSEASPGMRFGMYLAIWTNRADQEKEINHWANKRSPDAQEIRNIRDREGMDAAIAHARDRRNFPRLWEKNDFAARSAWNNICKLNNNDKASIDGLRARQNALLAGKDDAGCLTLFGRSTAPFVTGMGNEHPLENGFSFLWPYGIPYLPGSGVKGVLRQAARELASGQWGESEWNDEPVAEIKIGKKQVPLTAMDLLFGLESEGGGKEHFRGLLTFWDVIPKIQGGNLLVEIMTPHQSHYYQKGEQPHDSGMPTPIQFLTVPPGSGFNFNVVCDLPRLQRIAPELARDGKWKALMREALDHAFDWLGFGAKTAVGYGAMETDEDAQLEQEQARQEAREQAELEESLKELPEDAAELERARQAGTWKETNDFLQSVEEFLEGRDLVSSEALDILKEAVGQRWPGILENPEATTGKKKKPKYKPRPKQIALRILEIDKK